MFSLNVGKYGPEKLLIGTLFTQGNLAILKTPEKNIVIKFINRTFSFPFNKAKKMLGYA